MSARGWPQARNILCLRLDYLGDVLMTTPALRALRQSLPGCRITLLTSPGGVQAAPFIPEIDDAIAYDAPWLKGGDAHDVAHNVAHDMAMIRLLRRRRFDAAVIFTVYSQNPLPAALLCYLARIPLRLAHCHENPYRLLSDWVRDPEPQERVRHEVQRQLDLVATIGARTADTRLSFRVPPQDAAWAEDCLRSLGIARGRPWIVLHPGASAASRRYPAHHWRAVARELAARLACALVFTGSAQEADLAEQIGAGLPRAHALAGKLSLGQLAALIAAAPLLISNNTGPAHIAAALGTPVVDLYALTNPQHTPWQVTSRVLFEDVPCRFCYKSVCPQGHHRCLEGVPPARVVGAALELL
ncbi:MAG TPA: lipopolysaccharide heptosyltransferase II [Noviherbaspirillum sp.]|nr:lipopolysaccharide heptosyltransferase II [Noviherbaspirillum sp.]